MHHAVVDEATGRRLSYKAFNRRADAMAHALRHRFGIQKGDRIAVLAHNSSDILELFFAVGKLGAILVPINFRLVAREVKYILENSEAKVLFFGPDFAEMVRGLLPEVNVDYIVPFEADPILTSYEELLTSADGAVPEPAEIALDDAHVILYTSGTTGSPKGAVLTHGSITWNAINTQVGWDLTHDDITITHTPFFHTGGLNVLTTPLIHRGGTIVVAKQFDAGKTLEIIERERVTVLFAVPTMFQMMIEHPGFAGTDMSSVRFFISGGAACPVSLIEAYSATGVTFKQGYGLTEAGPNCFTLDAKDAVRKAGSVGFPNMHIDVRVVDEAGQDVPAGTPGELLIRGPHVCKGYWKNAEATAAAIKDGWLSTGDVVQRDEEGYFYIVDRKKDLFISGGENVYPAELEKLLAGHPAIAEAAVIGIPDEKWGEVGRAIVVTRPGHTLTDKDVVGFLADKLAKYKLPKSVLFVAELPRNSTGKVTKPALRELYGQAIVKA
jgi:fatty-acyl-CoA synthase